MAFKDLQGLWKSPKGQLSFKITDDFKQKVQDIPSGTYINVFEVREKKNPKGPDAKLTYRVDDEPRLEADYASSAYYDNTPF